MAQINWFNCFLFNGIAIPREDVIWPFRLFCYVLPYGWAQPTITLLSMVKANSWEGAFRCDPATGLAIDGPTALAANTTVDYCNPAVDENGDGFYCPDILPPACYGRTGKQVPPATKAPAHLSTSAHRNCPPQPPRNHAIKPLRYRARRCSTRSPKSSRA